MDEKLTINSAYAKAYEEKKRAEELSKLQEKYDNDVSESSSSEDEDDNAVEATGQRTIGFLRALSMVKTRDPRIYDRDLKLYAVTDDGCIRNNDTKETKPLFLRDYERQSLLHGRDEMIESDNKRQNDRRNLTYKEEQEELRQNLIQATAAKTFCDEILTVRVKSEEEKKADEKSYLEWLKGHETKLKLEYQNDMETLKEYWCNPQLESDEAFLRDYVLNQMWIDQSRDTIPMYDEILEEQSDDEMALEVQDNFERVYNFRFEEPGSSEILSYPRSITSSVRKPDSKRKDKRKAHAEKKAIEKKQKQEEIKRLKNLKKQEILDKLDKLREITGNTSIGFNDEDVYGEFDSSLHDKKMMAVFEDDYYKLEHEDIIGDIPCRFHYRPVVSNDFGLTTEEILTCEDKELNKWVSLKKAVQYRTKQEEKQDVKKYRLRSRDHKRKYQILASLKSESGTEIVKGASKKDKVSKKKKRRSALSNTRLLAYGLKKNN